MQSNTCLLRRRWQATKAFQLLVSAYEGLSQPDATKFDTSKPKTKTISRSNEGCHNTKICCPRCMVSPRTIHPPNYSTVT